MKVNLEEDVWEFEVFLESRSNVCFNVLYKLFNLILI